MRRLFRLEEVEIQQAEGEVPSPAPDSASQETIQNLQVIIVAYLEILFTFRILFLRLEHR
jgi:hypothetical protein